MKEIEHPALFTEWAVNIDKAAYKENLNKKHSNHKKKKRPII